jgi:hypothetical protein
LAAALHRIAPRLGSHNARTALDALARGDRAAAVSTLLPYYDHAYAHRLARNGSMPYLISVDGADVHRAADAILAAVADAQAIAV